MLVAKLCPALHEPMDCSPPGSSVHKISQARILEWVAISFSRGSSQPREWVAISFSRGSSQPRDWTRISAEPAVYFLPSELPVFHAWFQSWGSSDLQLPACAGFLDTTLPKYRPGLTAQLGPLYACPDLEPFLCRPLWSGDPGVRQAFPHWSCCAVLHVPDGMKLFAPTRVRLAKRRCAPVPALLCRTPLLGTFQSFQDLGLRFLNSASSITHQNMKL